MCSGQCVDTMNNPDFCGDCETVCGAGFSCNQGECYNHTGASCKVHADCLSGECTKSGTCAPPRNLVFISSVFYSGNLGGLSEADSKCQGLADAEGLPGTYKAWLSDSTGSPATRFTQSTIPYVLVDTTEIAANWSDLIDGSLTAVINKDEKNQSLSTDVWSNTHQITAGPVNDDCNDWKSDSSSVNGGYGGTYSTESSWTNSSYQSCSSIAPIFCFEQ